MDRCFMWYKVKEDRVESAQSFDVFQEILNVVSQQLVLLQQIQQLLQNAPVQQIVQQQQAQTSLLSQLSVGLTPFGGQNVS